MKRLSLFNHEKRINQLERRGAKGAWVFVILMVYRLAILGLGYVVKYQAFP
jgi:hypothetical protein